MHQMPDFELQQFCYMTRYISKDPVTSTQLTSDSWRAFFVL